MEWSREQERALSAVARWIEDPDDPVFRLFGYAGTGKTTLARHLAEGVKGNVLFGAYTGKAAHVLRQKGCSNAATIHSMIYIPKDKVRARLLRLEKELLAECTDHGDDTPRARELRVALDHERDNCSRPAFTLNPDGPAARASLIVLDEVSMVDDRMGHDLLSFGVPILALGDPGQLPPVARSEGYFTNTKPDILLEEIHRQAKGNPILEMATRIRKGDFLDLGDYGDSRVVTSEQLTKEDFLSPDQILVGRNITRHKTNTYVRGISGRTLRTPEPGDKLVCFRNDREEGLLNGMLFDTVDVCDVDDDTVTMTVASQDDGTQVEVVSWSHHFLGREAELKKMAWGRRDAQEFGFGYAMTVHKSQGSQWDDVLIKDEKNMGRAGDKEMRQWLYTAVTRASNRVTIVR